MKRFLSTTDYVCFFACIVFCFVQCKKESETTADYFVAESSKGAVINYLYLNKTREIGYSGTEILVKWKAKPGIVKYIIYCSTSQNFNTPNTLTFTLTSNSTVIKGLKNGIKYFFSLSYIDYRGNELRTSKITSATPTEYASVYNPGKFSEFNIQRIQLGVKNLNYKPTLIKLKDNSLLAMTFTGVYEGVGGKDYIEKVSMYRSFDNGYTWSQPKEVSAIKGREPFLSVLNDGTIIVTTHLLTNDIRNNKGYVYSYIYASYDNGNSWSESIIDLGHTTVLSRNVIEDANKDFLLAASDYSGKAYFYKSSNKGKDWPTRKEIQISGFKSDYPFGIFEESFLWYGKDGTIFSIHRVDSHFFPLNNPAFILFPNDQTDRMIVYSSKDGGTTFHFFSDLGEYGEMYPHLLKLKTGKLLLTYTIRSLNYPIGLRAVVGEETDAGFLFDLKNKVCVIDAKTPYGVVSGGGFGGTVQLDDGSLISTYSYRILGDSVNAEIARWDLPK